MRGHTGLTSTGLFRYPKDECAEVLIRGALEFDASPTKKTGMRSEWFACCISCPVDAHPYTHSHAHTGSLKQIRFTNFDKNTVDHFVHEIRNVQRRLASSS